jgi:hypothetical protein
MSDFRLIKGRISNPCKECRTKYSRDNKDRDKKSKDKYRLANKEKIYENTKTWRKKNPEKIVEHVKNWRSKNVDKVRTWQKYQDAILAGKIIAKTCCEKCNSQPVQAHHEDYSKPLEVIYLCKKCHSARHKEMRIEKENQRKE